MVFCISLKSSYPRLKSLLSRLIWQKNSADCDALFHLAGYLLLNGKYEKALQTLFQLFYIDRSYQAGTPQKAIIKVFDMLSGSEPELVTTYRRKFQSLLY